MSINQLSGVVSQINYENFEKAQQEMTDSLLESFKGSNLISATKDVKSAFDFLAMSGHTPYLNKMYNLRIKHLRGRKTPKQTEEGDDNTTGDGNPADLPDELQGPQDIEMSNLGYQPNRTNISQGEEPSTTSTQDNIMNEDEDVSDINSVDAVGDIPSSTPKLVDTVEADLSTELGEAAIESSFLDEIPIAAIITAGLGLASIVMEGIEGSKEEDDGPPTIPIQGPQLTSGFQSGISG